MYKGQLYNRTKRFGIDKFNIRLKNNYDIEHTKMVTRLKTQRYEMYQGTDEMRHANIEKGDYVTAFIRTNTVGINEYVQFGTVLDYNKENGVMKVHSPNQGTKIVNLHDSKIYELFVLKVHDITRRRNSPKPIRLDNERIEIQQNTQNVIDILNKIPKRTAEKHVEKKKGKKEKEKEKEEKEEKGTQQNKKHEKQEIHDKQDGGEKQILHQKSTLNSVLNPTPKPKEHGKVWIPEEIRNLTLERLNELSRADMLSLIKASGRWGAEYRVTKKSTDKLRGFLRKQLFS